MSNRQLTHVQLYIYKYRINRGGMFVTVMCDRLVSNHPRARTASALSQSRCADRNHMTNRQSFRGGDRVKMLA